MGERGCEHRGPKTQHLLVIRARQMEVLQPLVPLYRQFWHGASRSEARIPPGPSLGGASMKGFWDSLGI